MIEREASLVATYTTVQPGLNETASGLERAPNVAATELLPVLMTDTVPLALVTYSRVPAGFSAIAFGPEPTVIGPPIRAPVDALSTEMELSPRFATYRLVPAGLIANADGLEPVLNTPITVFELASITDTVLLPLLPM